MKIAHRLLLIFLIGIFLFGCGGKKSGIEGKVVDGLGQPISGLKVIIKQVQPVKGYEQFEATTGSDGIFRFAGIMPVSEYILSLWTDKWKTKLTMKVTSGTEGQTLVLNTPVIVRFNIMRDGSVIDTKTGLQWLIINGTDLSSVNVLTSIKSIQEGGFTDWRLPTIAELSSLQEKVTVPTLLTELDSTHEACCVWTGESNSVNIEWTFYVDDGNDLWTSSSIPANDRIVAVRTAGGIPTAAIPPAVALPPSNLPSATTLPNSAAAGKKEISAGLPAASEKKEVSVPIKEPESKNKESVSQQQSPLKKELVKKSPVVIKEELSAKPVSVEKAELSPNGNKISLYFGVNSVSVSAEDLAKLKSFYAKIKGIPGKLVIESHSDSSGSSSGRLKISSDRALNVYDTLVKLGLSNKVAVEMRSMGSAKPAGENDTVEGRKINRRVDLTFVP
jgi:outer membrane protein OmpA-like peptidoglycan-associated protein